jgi:hypothetical protein
VWTNETLTGIGGATPIVANYTSGFNGQWSRFREVPALGGFVYADGRSNPVQFWRPTIAPLFSFSTNFPLTENPISQGGIWQNGGGNGWQSVQTTPGKAFATGFGGQTFQGSEFDDPIAHLKTSVHAFTPNQYVEGTVYRLAGYSPNTNHEIELHGRQTITSGNAQGYEVLWAHTGEIAVVKWNGPLGNYTAILDNFQIGAAVNGDILRIELRGTVCTVKKNGVTVATVDLTMGGTLTTWNAGQPGMGMWPRGGGNAVLANYGWSSWRAGDL